MNGIKYYALDENEEVPYEFVVIGNVNGEPEFCASFVNTNSLAYGNGVLLKLHERNDELRAENAKLRELCSKFAQVVANDDVTFRKLREIAKRELGYDFIGAYDSSLGDMDQLPLFSDHMRELGVEV